MKTLGTELSTTLVIIISLLALSYLFPHCLSENCSLSYQLLDNPNGSTNYRLNVQVPRSLYEYYLGRSHITNTKNGFAQYVTPHALKPIADSLFRIYVDDEDFANGVLMIMHQIPYEETASSKYPAETIVENKGDCDLFSYSAASIMKAGGLDVVLLYYEHEEHMNIGVSLSHTPRDSRRETFYVTANSVRYYMAECTGGNWQSGWRVGECPDELEHATVQVISLEDCDQSTPGQVSAGYKALAASTLALAASATYAIQGNTITLSGQLSPNLQSENIAIYIRINNTPWMVLGTAATDSNGHFDYVWEMSYEGICYVRASWSGNGDYGASDSQTRTITILSTPFVALLTVMIVLVCVGALTYFMSRKTQGEVNL